MPAPQASVIENLAQGFLLAKPMATAELADLFASETLPLPRVASELT